MQVEDSYSRWVLPALSRAVSQSRLKRYKLLANGDPAMTLKLYHWNSALSEALHSALLSVEVTLRNAVNDRLRIKLGENWYDNTKTGLRHQQLEHIRSVKAHLALARKPTHSPNVVGNLSLGFWVGLFSSKYETHLWRTYLRPIFNRAPDPLLRSTVYGKLNRIRELRNRVAHHEPILHLPLANEYCSILEVTGWLCLATALYTARQSQFQQVLDARPQAG